MGGTKTFTGCTRSTASREGMWKCRTHALCLGARMICRSLAKRGKGIRVLLTLAPWDGETRPVFEKKGSFIGGRARKERGGLVSSILSILASLAAYQ
jgi:hypothetical protein